MKKKAITFLEIIIAASVMAIAMIPIFGMLSRQTVETDKNASQVFAINKATEILNTFIDNVSFVAIRAGNPGYIRVDDLQSNPRYHDELGLTHNWAQTIATRLFNSSVSDEKGFPCRGIIQDSKGISYLVHLKVEDIPSTTRRNKPERKQIGEDYTGNPLGVEEPDDFQPQKEVNFTFLKNPSILTSSKWMQDFAETPDETGKAFTELEVLGGVSEPNENFYKDDAFINPTAERYTAKMVMSKVPYETEEEFAWCPFKRLIIQVQWNLEPHYYSDPENPKGNTQRIHLMVIKGDIDS